MSGLLYFYFFGFKICINVIVKTMLTYRMTFLMEYFILKKKKKYHTMNKITLFHEIGDK